MGIDKMIYILILTYIFTAWAAYICCMLVRHELYGPCGDEDTFLRVFRPDIKARMRHIWMLWPVTLPVYAIYGVILLLRRPETDDADMCMATEASKYIKEHMIRYEWVRDCRTLSLTIYLPADFDLSANFDQYRISTMFTWISEVKEGDVPGTFTSGTSYTVIRRFDRWLWCMGMTDMRRICMMFPLIERHNIYNDII